MANQEISLVGVSATSLNIIPTLKDKESIILNEKDENFKVLSIKTNEYDTSEVEHHLILSLDRSGSMSHDQNGETKMDQTKHTVINILRWILENNYKIKCSIIIFDNVTNILFENIEITKENIVELISIINVDVYARNSTDIGSVFDVVGKVAEKHNDPNIKTSHIFMTDGIPTSGVVNREELIKLLPDIEYQYFIGFGVDHDMILLSGFAKQFTNSYYFVDCMENTGNIYGEILHNIVNNLISEIVIESKVYKMYDSITNTWVNKLCIKHLPVDSQRNIHIKYQWNELYKSTNYSTKDNIDITYILSAFLNNSQEYKIETVVDTYNYDYVYKFLWKQKVLETLYKYKEAPLLYSKQDIKHLLDKLSCYVELKKLTEDEFMKVLLDDLYISYKMCDKAEARIFIGGRHASSSNERAVMIKNINVRSMSQPLLINSAFTMVNSANSANADEDNSGDEDYDNYEISQEMNSLNLSRQQTGISRSISAPNTTI